MITVSRYGRFRRAPGHAGPSTCTGQADDTFLFFSNFGADVDVAAPGDCILSLGRDGKRRQLSGTSSASPHVAGAVAIFFQSFTLNNGFRPSIDQVRTWLLTQASNHRTRSSGSVATLTGFPSQCYGCARRLGANEEPARSTPPGAAVQSVMDLATAAA